MDKMSKKVFIFALIAMVVMMFNLKVNAATYDAEGYLILDEDYSNTTNGDNKNDSAKTTGTDNKNTGDDKTSEATNTTDKKDEKVTPTENKDDKNTNYANTATTPHSQAGSFENTLFITAGSILFILIGIGFVKLKKYNF